MSIIYDPKKILAKAAPAKKIKKLLTKNLTLKKTALSFVSDMDFIDKKSVAAVALKAIKSYKKRADEDPEQKAEIKDDPALLIQRVQNEIITQVTESIRENYRGEYYKWLPSDADEARPEHALNYGRTFQISDDEMPGDAYGCRCAMEILVAGSKLEL